MQKRFSRNSAGGMYTNYGVCQIFTISLRINAAPIREARVCSLSIKRDSTHESDLIYARI